MSVWYTETESGQLIRWSSAGNMVEAVPVDTRKDDEVTEETYTGPIKTLTGDDKGSPENLAPRAEILREVEPLILGDRNVSYGTPTQNFKNIAEMLTTRFRHKLKDGEVILGSDVADMMVLVKVARNIAQPKKDNFMDGIGYFACGYETWLDEQD